MLFSKQCRPVTFRAALNAHLFMYPPLAGDGRDTEQEKAGAAGST